MAIQNKHGMIKPYKKASSFEFSYCFPNDTREDHRKTGFETDVAAKREALRVLGMYKSGSVRVIARFDEMESEELATWTATPTACTIRRK